ncbi:FUSC family protein [Rhodococcus triatomae]
MPTLTADPSRLRRTRGALVHPMSGAVWRRSLRVRSADATVAVSLRVGLAAAVVLVAFGITGHGSVAGFALLGALSSAFSRHEPLRRTAQKVGLVGAAVVVSVLVGGLVAVSGMPVEAQIGVVAVQAGAAAALLHAFRVGGPGPVILVFAASAAVGYAGSAAHLGVAVASAAIGAAVGLVVAVLPFVFLPWGPARLSTARALGVLARVPAGADAAEARSAVVTARQTLALTTGPGARDHDLAVVLTEAEAALDRWLADGDAGPIRAVARHERELRKTKRHSPLPVASSAPGELPRPAAFLAPGLAGLGTRDVRVHTGRVVLAAALSGWLAAGLGLDHPMWASMGAMAAMQGITYAGTVERGIQRLLGNVAGAALAAGLIALSLGYWQTAVVIAVLQACTEVAAARNYGLCTMFVTPMALLIVGLGTVVGPEIGIGRVLVTVVGVVVGIVVAAVTLGAEDRAHLAEVA